MKVQSPTPPVRRAPVTAPSTQQLTHTDDDPWEPVISPDGDQILFASGTSSPLVRELHTVDIDGQNQRQLTDRRVNLSWQPAFSPDGEEVVYVVEKEANSDLHLMHADGSDSVNISNSNKGYWYPTFSPDGEWILSSSRDTESGGLELVRMRPDGSEKQQLTNLGAYPIDPVFTPDGEHIVFGLNFFGNTTLCSIEEDGENLKSYAVELNLLGEPSISPTTGKILFSAMDSEGDMSLYDIDLNSDAQPRKLVQSDFALAPTYSPDGTHMAWMASDEKGNMQIYQANADGSEIAKITNNDDFNSSPQYTPDGRTLVFLSSESGKMELHKAELPSE